MISVAQAVKLISQNVGSLGSEQIDLSESVGRVLAENVIADTDLPPFNRSQMDGYAVIASDTKKTPITLKLVGEYAAGSGYQDHARVRPHQRQHAARLGDVGERRVETSRSVAPNPVEVVRREAGAGDDVELVFGDAGNGEVALNAATVVE